MKTLFAGDYAAITFLASFLVGIAACITGWASVAAIAILAFYVGLDVLGWKWIVNGERTLLVGSNEDPIEIGSDPVRIDFLPFRYSGPAESAILAYRLIQHGVMIPILAAAGHVFGWQAAVAPLVVWITFGADILYFVAGRERLPAFDDETYFGYGYWNAPYGWSTYLAAKSAGVPVPPMHAGVLYGQAVLGAIAAILILI